MKANKQQQEDLFGLAQTDAEIQRSRRKVSQLTDPKVFAELRNAQLELASELIDARGLLDGIELEAKRAQEDLDTVEARIERDNARLNASSSSKDALGIQHELESLKKRKSDLEDLELEILERQESAKAAYDEIADRKAQIDSEFSGQLALNESELLKVRSGLDLLTAKRGQQIAQLPGELSALYEKKFARGVAVGRLVGRECGACRISLGATALNEIAALPQDEVATCPDCQAILVR
jgi:predicted  nucleic acid-binding Zn-ribbon protein